MDSVVEEEKQGIDDFRADAAESFGEDVGPEQEHGADGGFREGIAQTTGMAANEVALQFLQLAGLDANIRKFAEPGIDAIGGFATSEEGVDDGAGGLDAGQGDGIEGDGAGFERNLGNGVEVERLTGKEQRVRHHSAGYKVQERAYSAGPRVDDFSGRQAGCASI